MWGVRTGEIVRTCGSYDRGNSQDMWGVRTGEIVWGVRSRDTVRT